MDCLKGKGLVIMARDDSFTVSLLHGDGVDGSTTFTDEDGRIWTPSGNAQIDTAQKKFGTGSMLFDGTGDYISTPDSIDFFFGTENFTVDLQYLKNSLPGVGESQSILSQTEDANNYQ